MLRPSICVVVTVQHPNTRRTHNSNTLSIPKIHEKLAFTHQIGGRDRENTGHVPCNFREHQYAISSHVTSLAPCRSLSESGPANCYSSARGPRVLLIICDLSSLLVCAGVNLTSTHPSSIRTLHPMPADSTTHFLPMKV